MKISFKRAYLLGALVTAFSVGCASNGESAEGTSQDDIVVGVKDLPNHVAVFADRLEFDANVVTSLENLGLLTKVAAYEAAADKSAAEPVYFVGGREAAALNADGSLKADSRNPKGYLRKAISSKKESDGRVTVMTQTASVEEAVEEIKKNGYAELGGGVRTQDTGDVMDFGRGDFEKTVNHAFGDIPVIDLSGKELLNRTTLLGGKATLILKKGTITVNPTLDAHFSIKGFRAKEAHAILSTEASGELEIEATVDKVFDFNKSDRIYSNSWGTVVGGVPLSLSVDVDWRCELGMAAEAVATIGASAKGSIRAGGELGSHNFKGIFDKPTYELTRKGPELSSEIDMAGECHLIADLGVQLFDVAGPNAKVDVYAKTVARHSSALGSVARGNAQLVAGVTASVGGSLRPFGVRLGDINVPAFNYERELFNGRIGQ